MIKDFSEKDIESYGVLKFDPKGKPFSMEDPYE